jgi:integrase
MTTTRKKKSKELSPVYDTKRKSWRLSVSPSLSPSGKRQRLFFETQKLADLEADRLKGMAGRWGTEGRKIPAALAEDAVKASAVLKKYDVSLLQVARFYESHKKLENRSKTFADAWEIFESTRANKSDAHQSTLERIGNKLVAHVGSILVCNITADSIRSAIRQDFKTAHTFNLALRCVSPAFNMAVREGWTLENPCERIDKIDTGRAEVAVLNLNQSRKLMTVFADYRDDESIPENLRVDASGALAAVAIMLFGGVRPVETSRLEWSDVDMSEGTILVSNRKAKTDRSRYFKMPDALQDWLATVPMTERIGSITPSNWKRVWQIVRKKAGIGDYRDGLRKTFATMHLAAFDDVNKTRSIMGHEAGDVLFQNYRGLVRPKDAKAFWQILPDSIDAQEVAKMEAAV